MFPIAHGWLLARLTDGSPSPAAFLGCVWPDMLFGSPLTHQQSHTSGETLLDFTREQPDGAGRDALLDFTRGVITHGSAPHGFDWYSDESYGDGGAAKGYAFQRGAAIATRAAVACGVVEEFGLWKAHNLIEMAFERRLYQADPAAAATLRAACDDTDLMAQIAGPLAQFFHQDAAALAAAMLRYREVVSLAPDSLDALATIYAAQTRIRHPGATPDAHAIASLIGEAEDIVASDGETYLAICHAGVSSMLAALGL